MDVQTSWWWSSHEPMLRAAIDTFRPDFILELGSGQYSTPIFHAAGVPTWSVENDADWLARTKRSLPRTTLVEFIHHDLGPDIHITTKPFELTDAQRHDIARYYSDLVGRVPKADCTLAFVDQFTSARTLSINELLGTLDVILFHDCEPEGIPWYEYYFDESKTPSYDRYTLKTPKVWTGLFVRRTVVFDGFQLCAASKRHSDSYAKRNGLDPTEFFLQRGA